MPKHRDLLTKLLHSAERLLADAEHSLQTLQSDAKLEHDWHCHHLLAKSNVARIRHLLSVGDSEWNANGQPATFLTQ